jgi:hypothetical protein
LKESVLVELESKVSVELPLSEVKFGNGEAGVDAENKAEEQAEDTAEVKAPPAKSGRRRGQRKNQSRT